MSARARVVWRSSGETRSPAPPARPPRTPWWRHVYRDYRRQRMQGSSYGATLLSRGFWASAAHRICQGARGLPTFAALMQAMAELLTTVRIPRACEVGAGIWIAGGGRIHVADGARIGDYCAIAHGVTIEASGKRDARGAPAIGDRVYIGPNAILLGKITVGDDALVCPGAVLMRSVPARAVVLGNPARIVSFEGSFDEIVYDDMEMDAARTASRLQR